MSLQQLTPRAPAMWVESEFSLPFITNGCRIALDHDTKQSVLYEA